MTKQELKAKIDKLENGIKSKATPSNLIAPLKAQKAKLEKELEEMESAEKKAVKTKKVSKVAEKIKAAKKSVAKKTPAKAPAKEERKKDNIARDGDRKSLPAGKRISKTGKVYYETRANRSDKQTSVKPYLADGGMTDGMASVNEIARLTGLRPVAVAEWGDKNNINLSVILKDLKSKKIKGMDLMTAVVGKPNNKYQKELLDKYSKNKMADGGEVKWQDVNFGDSALVISENKMGLVIKPYGRKFHLKFADGSEKTYDAKELQFFQDKMAKGGNLKVYDSENSYRLSRPSGSIEKELLKNVSFSEEDFVGNFGWKTTAGKLADGYLYNLDESDQELVKDIKLKEGEKIYRYFTRTTAIGGIKPLIKINLDKGLLYFPILQDNEDIVFETRGIQAMWVSLIGEKMAKGGTLNSPKFLEYYQVLDRWAHYRLTIEKGKEYYLPTESTIEKILANDIMFNDGKVDKSTHDKMNTLLVQQLKELKMNAYPEYAYGGELKSQNGKNYKEEFEGSNRWLEVDDEYKMTKSEHESEAFRANSRGNYELRDKHREISQKLSEEPIKMADGGKIKNQYEGKTAKEVWDNLSKEQRQHFLYDHKQSIEDYRGEEYGELKSKEIIAAYNSDWDKLDKNIKNRFDNHVREGQYAHGGYVIFEGHDHYNDKPLYKVISKDEDNDYEGEFHDNREDAEKELNELKNKDMKYANGGKIYGEQSIKDFYINTYPTDDLGQKINGEATFDGLNKVLNCNVDVYEYLGVGDSLVRERVFEKLAEIDGVSYDVIYDKWLSSDSGDSVKLNYGMAEEYINPDYMADGGEVNVGDIYKDVRSEQKLEIVKVDEPSKEVTFKIKDSLYTISKFSAEHNLNNRIWVKQSGYMADGGMTRKGSSITFKTKKEAERRLNLMKGEKDYTNLKIQKVTDGYAVKFDFQDKMADGGYMADGGQVPAHFGSGKNIEVFGYETKHFDICGTAVKEFEAAVDIMKDSKELEKESLAYCAKYVDNLFGIEKAVVEGGIGGELNFSHAVSDIMSAATYNFRAGMAINLYSFVPQHLMEIALRLAKAEKGGLYALGGMTAGRWYRDKSGEEFKFIGRVDSGANKGRFLFTDGQKSVYKDLEEFEGGKPKETKLFGFFEDGGSIPNNYEGMSAKDVWNSWTYDQKFHFLTDHKSHKFNQFKESRFELSDIADKSSYDDLPKNIQLALNDHIDEGQYAKGGELNSIKEEYLKNEDENAHSENVVLLAKHFGTKDDLAEAKRILALHEKEGHLSSENGKKRQQLHLKLIDKATKEMAKEGIEFEKGGYMAEGGQVSGKFMFRPYKREGKFFVSTKLKNVDADSEMVKGVQGKLKGANAYSAENVALEILKQHDDIDRVEIWKEGASVLKNKKVGQITRSEGYKLAFDREYFAKGGEVLYLESVGTYFRPSDMTTSPMEDFENEGEIGWVYENSDEWWEALSKKDKETIGKYNREDFSKKMKEIGYMAKGGEISGFEKKIKDALKVENKWHFFNEEVDGKNVQLKMFVGKKEVDVQIFRINGLGAKMPRNYVGKRETLKMIMDNFEPKMAKGGEVEFVNSNLYLNGFGMDSNGNKVVKVSFPNQRAFSIQTNGVLNETNNLYTKNIGELTEAEIKTIEKEVVEYVKQFGSKEQKQRLKTYSGYMAKGGETNYTKKWKVVGITMQGKRFEKEITLGRMSDKNDVKNALKRMPDTQIREVTSIQEVMAKGGEIEAPHKVVFFERKGMKGVTAATLEGESRNYTKAQIKEYLKKSGVDATNITFSDTREFDNRKYKELSGGKVKFADKLKAVQESLLKRKKVAPQVQKDYGKTYSKAEAKESAQRIVGSRMAQLKEKMAKKKMAKGGTLQDQYDKLKKIENEARNSYYKARDTDKWYNTIGNNYMLKWEKQIAKLKKLDGFEPNYNFGDVIA